MLDSQIYEIGITERSKNRILLNRALNNLFMKKLNITRINEAKKELN
jgi:hypothetical protein